MSHSRKYRQQSFDAKHRYKWTVAHRVQCSLLRHIAKGTVVQVRSVPHPRGPGGNLQPRTERAHFLGTRIDTVVYHKGFNHNHGVSSFMRAPTGHVSEKFFFGKKDVLGVGAAGLLQKGPVCRRYKHSGW